MLWTCISTALQMHQLLSKNKMPLATNSILCAQTVVHISIRVFLASLGAEMENLPLQIFLLLMRSLSKRTARSCVTHQATAWNYDTNHTYCLWSIHWANISKETKIEVGKWTNWRQDTRHSDALPLITGLLISWQRKIRNKQITNSMFYTNDVKILHDLTEYSNIILGVILKDYRLISGEISPYGFPE